MGQGIPVLLVDSQVLSVAVPPCPLPPELHLHPSGLANRVLPWSLPGPSGRDSFQQMLGTGEEKQMLNSRTWQIEPMEVFGIVLTPEAIGANQACPW